MPLRDHFRPPLKLKRPWDVLHGMWPAAIVQDLFNKLPPGYVAGPRVHLGTAFEVDVANFAEDDVEPLQTAANGAHEGGGVATAVWAPAAPTLTLEAELPEQDEYEVLIYDEESGQTVVAAVEIVSPSNKDRPESRRVFVAKMAALLQRDVCVSIVDLVTVRQFNLYSDLLELLGESDPALKDPPPFLYAATLRRRKRPRKRLALDAWFYPLTLGQAMPTLPIWLDERLAAPLDLETTYEDACRVLRIH